MQQLKAREGMAGSGVAPLLERFLRYFTLEFMLTLRALVPLPAALRTAFDGATASRRAAAVRYLTEQRRGSLVGEKCLLLLLSFAGEKQHF
jgi:hypothetical protein